MWVTAYGDGEVQKIDPKTNTVAATYETDGSPCGVVFVDGSVWVGSVSGEVVDQIDPETGKTLTTIPVGGQVYDVQAGFGSVWVDNRDGGQVLRIDPATAKVVARIPAGKVLYGLELTDDAVWATSQLDNTIIRIDPKTNKRVAVITDPHDNPFTFAETAGALWVSHADGAFAELDTKTNRFLGAVHTTPRSVGDSDAAGGSVWYPDRITGKLLRIDPRTAKVTAKVELEPGYAVAQEGFGDLWVANFGGEGLARIDPSKV
jgi:streptogramin lyase